MASIVVIENEASPSRLAKVIESAKSISDDLLLVGDNKHSLDFNGHILIRPSQTMSLGKALRMAASQAKYQDVIIADARTASFSALKRFNDSATINPEIQFELASTEVANELIQLPLLSPENIVAILGLYTYLPLQVFRINRSIITEDIDSAQSVIAWGSALLIKAISDHNVVNYQEQTLALETKSTIQDVAFLTDAERAQLLSLATELNNIEDLFPRHAWKEHREESAAAAYHSLAALFVRLGDTQAADDCLQLSDSLEDSPRSLALKGLIAKERGEVLGAVANLVSSLQQYETRKRNNGEHYLTFAPKDIENINSKLQAGLEALNKRENTTAFDHFAEAIFNFDDFYSTYGVDKPR